MNLASQNGPILSRSVRLMHYNKKQPSIWA